MRKWSEAEKEAYLGAAKVAAGLFIFSMTFLYLFHNLYGQL